jgi:hypothetical protein
MRLADGSYKITVTASDGANEPVTVKTLVQGRVEGVEYVDNSPYVVIGGNRVPYSEVVSIRENTD